MQTPKRFLSQHRRDRLIAWALAMLNWLASVLFAERVPARRHIARRYRLVSLRGLTRLVVRLAAMRALEITHIHARHRIVRNTAPCGFRRRTRPWSLKRAIMGARLRKAFRRGDLAQRIQFLIAALRDIDAFARRYLVPRARRRLTKLCAIVMFAPPAAAFLGPPAPPPACADSS